MKRAWIYIEDGTFLEAKSFGSSGTKVAEMVFNTSMSGYQEIMSDPSYAGQFVIFTMPEIGIVGTNNDDLESKTIHSCGMIVRNYSHNFSNFRATLSLESFLREHGALGICDIDTRYLTKKIRDNSPQMTIISTELSDKEELKKILKNSPRIEEINYIKEVSTKRAYRHYIGSWDPKSLSYKRVDKKGRKNIVVIDFGVKTNILNELCEVGFEVEVVPCDFEPKELIQRYNKKEINGILLSNGPGDPMLLKDEIKKIKELIEAKIPLLGICLGHQLLSISHSHPTYKLSFGQHGGNHPVQSQSLKTVEITSQNHNYNVPASICSIAKPTHINLFDNTIEGLEYIDSNIFSLQHHPEASPGPHDSKYIFKEFFQRL